MIEHHSAGIVVYRTHNDCMQYLILHYAKGHWDLPKGHMEPGETKEQTALRELQEETGLTAKIDPGFEETFDFYFSEDGNRHHKVVYFFKGKADSGDVVLSHEHQDYKWLDFDQAIKQLTFENAKELLKKINMKIKK